MALIKYKEWLAKNEDMSNAMGQEFANPSVQQLQARLNDPATPPESKQNIILQLQQLQTRSQPQQNMQNTQGPPPNQSPNQQAQPVPNPNPAPANQPNYIWKNGKPVPAYMNQV